MLAIVAFRQRLIIFEFNFLTLAIIALIPSIIRYELCGRMRALVVSYNLINKFELNSFLVFVLINASQIGFVPAIK